MVSEETQSKDSAKDEKNNSSTADESVQDKEKDESSTGGETMADESNDSSNGKKGENGDAKAENNKDKDNQIEDHPGVKVLLDVFTKELPTPTDGAPVAEKEVEAKKESADTSKE